MTAAKKIDPFKKAKAKDKKSAKGSFEIECPQDVSNAISSWAEAKEAYDTAKGEMTIHSSSILEYGKQQYASRALKGDYSSLKLKGENAALTFVVAVKAKFDDEEVSAIENKFGEDEADSLLNAGDMSLNSKFISDDIKERMVSALQKEFSNEELANLFAYSKSSATADVQKKVIKELSIDNESDYIEAVFGDFKVSGILKK